MSTVVRDIIRLGNENNRNSLPMGQRVARLTVCRRVAGQGGSVADAAAELDMDISALWRWLQNTDPTLRETLAAHGRGVGRQLSRGQHIARLRMAVTFTNKAYCAERLGISPPAMGQWLKTHAPDGPRAALEKLGVSV